jgi:outer membrane protein assembly factor BamB
MRYILFLMLSITLLSCKKEGQLPRFGTAGKVLWKFPLHKDGNFHSNSIIREHLVYDNKVLLGTTNGEDNRFLTCVDVNTGQELWSLGDIYEPPSEKIEAYFAYLYDNKMAYVVGSRHYCINLNDGSTFWKIRRDRSFDVRIWGLENTYFVMASPTDTLEQYNMQVGYWGDLNNGNIEQFLLPDVDTSTGGENRLVTSINWIKPFTDNGHRYLVVLSSNPYPNWYYNVMVGLYDLDNQTWLYNGREVTAPKQNNVISNVYIDNGKVYISGGNELACHDLWTGNRVWKSNLPSDLQFSGFIVADGRVVVNSETSQLLGLNANTGAPLWSGEGSGTSSFLEGRYLNEVVYFSGGSSGKIHAVDTKTGKTVWKLDPALADDGADWKPDIYVVPGQNGDRGRVIVCTHNNAYCLEAYR